MASAQKKRKFPAVAPLELQVRLGSEDAVVEDRTIADRRRVTQGFPGK